MAVDNGSQFPGGGMLSDVTTELRLATVPSQAGFKPGYFRLVKNWSQECDGNKGSENENLS